MQCTSGERFVRWLKGKRKKIETARELNRLDDKD